MNHLHDHRNTSKPAHRTRIRNFVPRHASTHLFTFRSAITGKPVPIVCVIVATVMLLVTLTVTVRPVTAQHPSSNQTNTTSAPLRAESVVSGPEHSGNGNGTSDELRIRWPDGAHGAHGHGGSLNFTFDLNFTRPDRRPGHGFLDWIVRRAGEDPFGNGNRNGNNDGNDNNVRNGNNGNSGHGNGNGTKSNNNGNTPNNNGNGGLGGNGGGGKTRLHPRFRPPLIRHVDRRQVIERQFIVVARDAQSVQRLQSRIYEQLSNLTASTPGQSGKLPFGVRVQPNMTFTFNEALHGFTVQLNIERPQHQHQAFNNDSVIEMALNELLDMDGVSMVEEDVLVNISAPMRVESVDEVHAWHLDRIDQRGRVGNGDGLYHFNATGQGVHAYIVDTGIRKTHFSFGDRVSWDYSVFDWSTPPGTPPDAGDYNGHGTHVAGIVGSSVWGVAKDVALHSVRVMDANGIGTTSGVIAGLDYVSRQGVRPAIAVLSLGSAPSSSLDAAVRNAISSGVIVVVAAGNDDDSACSFSPSRVSTALTVSASDNHDQRASFSNWGACSDLFAPGVHIVSASSLDDVSSVTMSGTSMSAPMVAGVAALYLERNPKATPAQLKNDLLCMTTYDAITDAKETPNRMLFSFTRSTIQPSVNGSNLTNATATSTSNTSAAAASWIASSTASVPVEISQAEACTPASPCEGPCIDTLTTDHPDVMYAFNATRPGVHRAWLQYAVGTDPYNPISNHLYFMVSTGDNQWYALAADTSDAYEKFLVFDAPMSGLFAWGIHAIGATPSSILLNYKLPEAPVLAPDVGMYNSTSGMCAVYEAVSALIVQQRKAGAFNLASYLYERGVLLVPAPAAP